jgi:hypothetical protein
MSKKDTIYVLYICNGGTFHNLLSQRFEIILNDLFAQNNEYSTVVLSCSFADDIFGLLLRRYFYSYSRYPRK